MEQIKMIKEFKGKWTFLSNFYAGAPFFALRKGTKTQLHRALLFWTSEHYFQYHKIKDEAGRLKIRQTRSPKEAKRLGNLYRKRDDWEEIRDSVMLEGVFQKFFQSTILRNKLLSTGTVLLQEGNWWGDDYWGVNLDTGEGANKLGKILMHVRWNFQRIANESSEVRAVETRSPRRSR